MQEDSKAFEGVEKLFKGIMTSVNKGNSKLIKIIPGKPDRITQL